MWLFLLDSPFGKLVLLPPSVLAVLDLYYEHFLVVFLEFFCGLHLMSSLDSWWILELSLIHT